MASLDTVLQYLHRAILIPIIILGTFGNIFNILIFTRVTLRQYSCSIYLLASSVSNCVVLYCAVLFRLLIDGFGIDPTIVSESVCKLISYIQYTFPLVSSTFIVFACIDRFAASSSQARWRKFSQRKVTLFTISLNIIICFICYIHVPIYFKIIRTPISENDFIEFCYCQGGYNQFFIVFHMIFYSSFQPLLMTVFGLLTLRNVQRLRRQINQSVTSSTTSERHHQRDRQIIRLLLVQVLIHVILLVPGSILISYATFIPPSPIISFITGCSIFLIYLSFIQGFYVNTLSAKTYRSEFYKILSLIEKRLFNSNMLEHQLMERGLTQEMTRVTRRTEKNERW
ncbi:unnamed protein product [Didymodactylos carnosus]|uniref:G-protein coupled receptors family 1 profile domain-containing protein n=1 Tax=Didymodactylos carnosus TaxID=1234261 RepID=A0A814GNX7_9BILA|nr:unnamed protein product [Didymodactylos carnosus]CAF1101914.1 unnamed protein product [Didymodactylos carnosus]CAF3770273.1 unnamed protein product [Didymodactylos carnosus]CAF3863274.1 unnamed protein product [Didymodactylos carnosus]